MSIVARLSGAGRVRCGLLASAAAASMVLAAQAAAAPTVPPNPPCGDVAGVAVTCTGDLSAGVSIVQTSSSPAYAKLTVKDLLGDVDPGTKTNGIQFMSSKAGAVEVFSDLGPNAIKVDGIIITNLPALGILAQSSNDYARAVSTGNVIATTGARGISVSGQTGAYLKSTGTITADGTALAVRGSTGKVTFISNGAVTSTSGTAIAVTNNAGGDTDITISGEVDAAQTGVTVVQGSAMVASTGALVFDSSAKITAAAGPGVWLNGSAKIFTNSGKVKFTSRADIISTASDGILARISNVRTVSIYSYAKVTSDGAAGIRFDPVGTTAYTDLLVKATGDISAKTTGMLLRDISGAVTVSSSGRIDAVTGDGISVDGFHAGSPNKSISIENSGMVDAASVGIKGIETKTLTVLNSGKVTAASSDGIYGEGHDIKITNASKGEIIASAGKGIYLDGFNKDGSMTVVNDGTIQSKFAGIHLRPREDITIEVSGAGNVTSSNASGIYIEAWAAKSISITAGGEVTGAAGFAGIEINRSGGGYTNSTINVLATGHVRNAGSALDQLAIWARENADDTVINFGKVTGNVDLGDGANSFDNRAGGMFVMGPKVMIGAGRKLSNAGTISPGGDGNVLTVNVTGNVEQAAGGRVAG